MRDAEKVPAKPEPEPSVDIESKEYLTSKRNLVRDVVKEESESNPSALKPENNIKFADGKQMAQR